MRGRASVLLVAALAAAASTTGCGAAVRHPAITAGVVGGTLGFATCKLASDDYPACLGVAGGVGAFLGLITAAALWLGGDGHSVLIEDQAQPLPDDGRPITRRRKPPATERTNGATPAGATDAKDASEVPPVTSPVPLSPAPAPAPPPSSP